MPKTIIVALFILIAFGCDTNESEEITARGNWKGNVIHVSNDNIITRKFTLTFNEDNDILMGCGYVVANGETWQISLSGFGIATYSLDVLKNYYGNMQLEKTGYYAGHIYFELELKYARGYLMLNGRFYEDVNIEYNITLAKQ